MKTKGIPLNGSIVVPVSRSMKCVKMTLYEKHNIENEWPNIRARNKSTSVER